MSSPRQRSTGPRAGARGARARRGVVYVLSNQAMPGLLKIGMTTRTMQERLRELNSATGVPVPYRVEAVVEAEDARAVERETHRLLLGTRVNDRREFFRADVGTALAAAEKASRIHRGRMSTGVRGRPRPKSLLSAAVMTAACLPLVQAVHEDLSLPWVGMCAFSVLTGRPEPLRDLVLMLAGRGILAHASVAALGGISAAILLRWI